MSARVDFCYACGQRKVVVPADHFNTATGERETTNVCANEKCWLHCLYVYGGCQHGMGWSAWFSSKAPCIRCGTMVS